MKHLAMTCVCTVAALFGHPIWAQEYQFSTVTEERSYADPPTMFLMA